MQSHVLFTWNHIQQPVTSLQPHIFFVQFKSHVKLNQKVWAAGFSSYHYSLFGKMKAWNSNEVCQDGQNCCQVLGWIKLSHSPLKYKGSSIYGEWINESFPKISMSFWICSPFLLVLLLKKGYIILICVPLSKTCFQTTNFPQFSPEKRICIVTQSY